MKEIITPEDLQVFKQELLLEIKMIIQDKPVLDKQFLRSSEVRHVLKISSGKLQDLRNSGLLPFSKVGGTIFYSLNDVESMIKNSCSK